MISAVPVPFSGFIRESCGHVQDKAKQSKAKMCNGRRHVPLCPAYANKKISSAKVQLYYSVIIRIYLTSVPNPG